MLARGLAWAGGNIVAKASGARDMLAFVVWASLFSVPPLLALSLALEGWPAIGVGLAAADAATWAAVVWQASATRCSATPPGAGCWRGTPPPASRPLALLVPVFGIGASACCWASRCPPGSWSAAALVIAGLAIGVLYPRLAPRVPHRGGPRRGALTAPRGPGVGLAPLQTRRAPC